MDSSAEACGSFDNISYGVVPPPFSPRGTCLCMCSQGDFLDLRSDRCGCLISLLQQSSAAAINLVLGVSRESKASVYSA